MQISRNFLSGALASALILGIASGSDAQSVFGTVGTVAGNQNFFNSMGTYFTIASSLGEGFTVDSIGVFDSNADGIAGTLTAAIFNVTTSSIVSGTQQTFTSGSPGTLGAGSYRFKSITPVTLAPGSYAIVGRGFGSSDLNYNAGADSGAPPSKIITIDAVNGPTQLTFSNTYFDGTGNASLILPTTLDGAKDRYGAGAFTVVIPEPGTLALLGFGLAPVTLAIRRRRK
ncbi:PEP-CTERM sorting domain-containing protein [Armatimonas sp.]|uniref:PEP-CTERM sorting domain-containing protein n=1 Tax=Armatimonas sp. TaxID=1872638 RepID=UPI0037500BFC